MLSTNEKNPRHIVYCSNPKAILAEAYGRTTSKGSAVRQSMRSKPDYTAEIGSTESTVLNL